MAEYYINNSSISRKIKEQGKRAIVARCKEIIQPRVDAAQKYMLQVFDAHPVTYDLKTGQNTSGYLARGDLYSFLGFDIKSKTDPTEKIRKILEKPIKVSYLESVKGAIGNPSSLYFAFEISLPSLVQIEMETENDLSWIDGFSWVFGIENGSIPGIQFYINIEGAGRSWGGIQNEIIQKPATNSQNATPYITEVLKAFLEKLRSFRK